MFSYPKLIGIGVALLSVYLGYVYVSNLQEQLIQKEKEVQALTISNQSLQKEKEKIQQNLEVFQRLSNELAEKYQQAEEKRNNVIRLFADHNFSELVEKKPGLITRKMQKATKKLFQEFEQETRQ